MDDDYLFGNLDIGYCPHCGRLLESYELVVCTNCEEAE